MGQHIRYHIYASKHPLNASAKVSRWDYRGLISILCVCKKPWLVRMHVCTGSSEPLLLPDARAKILCADLCILGLTLSFSNNNKNCFIILKLFRS